MVNGFDVLRETLITPEDNVYTMVKEITEDVKCLLKMICKCGKKAMYNGRKGRVLINFLMWDILSIYKLYSDSQGGFVCKHK